MAAEIAARLRQLAAEKPSDIYARLQRLAVQLEQGDDIAAMAHLVTPPAAASTPTRPRARRRRRWWRWLG